MIMKELIIEKLAQIEREEDIKILHAVESGSRAWGFPSPDSDYDVRFIYVRKPEYYLKLEKTRDVIELPINDMLDINGWDLNKTLRLLHSSNPTLFEWMSSPIVYRQTDFIDRLSPILDSYFSSFIHANKTISRCSENIFALTCLFFFVALGILGFHKPRYKGRAEYATTKNGT